MLRALHADSVHSQQVSSNDLNSNKTEPLILSAHMTPPYDTYDSMFLFKTGKGMSDPDCFLDFQGFP